MADSGVLDIIVAEITRCTEQSDATVDLVAETLVDNAQLRSFWLTIAPRKPEQKQAALKLLKTLAVEQLDASNQVSNRSGPGDDNNDVTSRGRKRTAPDSDITDETAKRPKTSSTSDSEANVGMARTSILYLQRQLQATGSLASVRRLMQTANKLYSPMEMEIEIFDDNGAFAIPTRNATIVSVAVDWGDGSDREIFTQPAQSLRHVYRKPGIYTVRVFGHGPGVAGVWLDGIGGDLTNDEIDAEYSFADWVTVLTRFPSLGSIGITNLSELFRNAPGSLESLGLEQWNTHGVVDMSYMFADAREFNADITNWDVSTARDMTAMFESCFKFNRPLNLWDVSKVLSMRCMFAHSGYNSPLDKWNTKSVTNMSEMFSGSDFNQSIGNWNVENVTNMSGMFYETKKFDQPLDSWNVGKVKDMAEMFSSSPFNQPLANWNVTNVTTMVAMFAHNSVFNQPIGNWDVSNVVNMNSMFEGSATFNQNISTWDVSNVRYFRSMFRGAKSFNTALSNWNVKNATNMENMFRGAVVFNQDISSWDVSKVERTDCMFMNAVSFNQELKWPGLPSLISAACMFFNSGIQHRLRYFLPYSSVRTLMYYGTALKIDRD